MALETLKTSSSGILFVGISRIALHSSADRAKLLTGQSSQLVSDELLLEQMQDAVEACQSADLFIFTMLALWGYPIAEKLGVPSFVAATLSVSPTRSFPFLQFAKATNPLIGTLNYASYLLVEFLGERQKQPLINRFR